MIRRFGAAVMGLLLSFPIVVAPVGAHGSLGLVVGSIDVWTDTSGDTHVTGVVSSHASTRRTNIRVTASWVGGASETTMAVVTSLAPHGSAPFEIIEDDTDVSAAGNPGVIDISNPTESVPVGALSIGSVNLVGDVATISVTNDSTFDGVGIQVHARRLGGSNNDVSASAPASLASGATADFAVTFDPESDGTLVRNVIAGTTAGPLLTSWNNYFGDLGASLFAEEIGFMAERGHHHRMLVEADFCPRNSVTRAEMAVFLPGRSASTTSPSRVRGHRLVLADVRGRHQRRRERGYRVRMRDRSPELLPRLTRHQGPDVEIHRPGVRAGADRHTGRIHRRQRSLLRAVQQPDARR